MVRLIIVNGPPGLGKSTLARLYVDEHPLALNLDIDRVRGLLGQWQTEPTCAGLLARQLSLAMAGTHLRAGHDVVVPQYIARVEFLHRLEQVAADAGAQFHELMLTDGKDSSARLFLVRADSTGLAVHREAHDMLDRAGGRRRLEQMYDRLQDILTARPGTRVVPFIDGQINDTYQALVQHLTAVSPRQRRADLRSASSGMRVRSLGLCSPFW